MSAEDAGACQSTGPVPPSHRLPWSDREHADDLTRLFGHIVDSPEGVVSLAYLAGGRYGPGAVETAGAEYQRVRRFVDWCEEREWVKTTSRGRCRMVFPTPNGVSLYRSMQSVGTPEGEGVGVSASAAPSEPSGSGSTARESVRSVVGKVGRVESDAVWSGLLRSKAAHRGGTDGTYLWFRDRLDADRYARVPRTDRWNDPGTARSVRSGFEAVCDAATERYDVATWLTLTVPPEVSSVGEAWEQIHGWKNRLNDRLDYAAETGPERPGRVPEHLTVPEPHADGRPHLHVVYFGVSRLMDWRVLRQWWADIVGVTGPEVGERHGAGGGPATVQVDVRRLALRSGAWRVRQRVGDGTGRAREYGAIRDYLRGCLQTLAEFAEESPDDLHARADRLRDGAGTEQDRDLARLTLFWATEKALYTVSPSLRPSPEPSLPYAPRWEFVGIFPAGKAPAYMTERAARFEDRPPPADAGDAGGVAA